MYCYSCGKPLPEGADKCPACQAPVLRPPAAAAGDAVDQFVADVRKSTRELIHGSIELSKHVASKAGDAAKDPKGSAKKASHRVAEGLREIARDLDKELKDL